MNSHELRDILNKIEKDKDTNLKQMAIEAHFDRSYVSRIINSRTPIKVGAKLFRKVSSQWPEYFESNKNNTVFIEVAENDNSSGVNSGSRDHELISFLQKVEEKQQDLVKEIGVFLKGYSQTISESGTDLPKLTADVEKLAGIGGEKGKGRKGKGDHNKKA